MFVHSHTDGKERFDQAMSAVRASLDLVALGKDGRGEDRFTSRNMIETEDYRQCRRYGAKEPRHHRRWRTESGQGKGAGALRYQNRETAVLIGSLEAARQSRLAATALVW